MSGATLRSAVLAAALAALPAAACWGFTVDDAWISVRVAAHVARGHGHRFNPGGPVVDAVTPLPWPYLLAPAARWGALSAWEVARSSGVLAWLGTAAWLGARVARLRRGRWALLPLLTCVPLGAWSSSGMETALATLLATLALAGGGAGALSAGLAATLRPELVPWAATMVLAEAAFDARGPALLVLTGRTARRLCLALGPAALVAIIRALAFGSPLPLAVWAKPADTTQGAMYVVAGLVHGATPVLLLARRWSALSSRARALGAAFGVHLAVVTLAGGDWMPYGRLLVPVLPGLVWIGAELNDAAAAHAASVGGRALTPALRGLAGALVGGWLLVTQSGVARGIAQNRLDLVARAGAALAGRGHLAALDVGWVGLASDAPVLDLAGVTDPRVARRPGPHHDKRLDRAFLEHEAVDGWLLLVVEPGPSPCQALYARPVEARVARELCSATVAARLPLPGTTQEYWLLVP